MQTAGAGQCPALDGKAIDSYAQPPGQALGPNSS